MQFIVDFKDNATSEAIEQYLADHAATIVKVYNNFTKTYLVECESTPVVNELIEHVILDEENPLVLLNTVIYSNQNYGTEPSDSTATIENNNDNWWKTYVVKDPKLDATTYTIDRKGSNTIVYVLDSGIDTSHPEFDGQNVENLWSFTGDFTDTAGHGTSIASVINGKTCGVTSSTVKSVKIFDNNVATKQSDMLNALDAIVNDSFANPEKFAVVNCSWTITKNSLIENKIQYMINNSIFFVAAAGNSGQPIDNVTPAGMNDVMTIGAFDIDLNPCDFSNYTDPCMTSLTQNETNHGALDGWAPGKNIRAAGLNNTYGMVAGTSIAAGIHSAVVAYDLGYSHINSIGPGADFVEWYTVFSLFRKGLLNLTDAKYENSNNRISTIHPILDSTAQNYVWLLSGNSGQFIRTQLFNPRVSEKLELLAELPENYTITEYGEMFGKAPVLTEGYQHLIIPTVLTKVDGTVINNEIEIIVMGENQETTGDPILDLKLQAYICNGACADPMGGDQCKPICGPGGSCASYDKTCPVSNLRCDCV